MNKKQIVATYDYRDKAGALLFQVVRYEPKGFAQRRPDVNDGWVWGLDGVQRVLYRLPELLESSGRVFICEGEKDVDRLRSLGLTATTSGAAGSWRPEFAGYLKGREVIVIADNDGLMFSDEVAKSVSPVASSVKIIYPSNAEHGDISDWLDEGHTVDELQNLVETTPLYECAEESAPTNVVVFPGATKQVKKSQKELLVECLPDDAELFHTPDGTEHVTVTMDDHRETYAVGSTAFRQYLTRCFYLAEGKAKAPSAQALRDAIGLIAARARYDGSEQEVFLRTAESDGAVWVDLCDAKWRAVQVTATGWTVTENSTVRFRRAHGMLPLPIPEPGTLDEIADFLNLGSHDDRVLVLTWLTAALRPRGPYPILALHGEQGSGKSSTARMIRSLVDPNKAPLRTLSRDERDLHIAANNAHCVSLDNVSRLTGWLSDSLCRLATGGGLATRTLYANADETIFDAQRPILLNGIDDCATRGDFAERSIVVYLPRIDSAQRRDERELWAAFETARPRIFGALLTAVAGGLAALENGLKVANLPRMADFALWGHAVEASLSFQPGTFASAYAHNRADANTVALEASPVAHAVRAFAADRSPWTGTASALLGHLQSFASHGADRDRSWPQTPRVLAAALRRLAPNLMAAGVEVRFSRHGREGQRCVSIVCASVAPVETADAQTQGQFSQQPSVSAVSSSKQRIADDADATDANELIPTCQEGSL